MPGPAASRLAKKLGDRKGEFRGVQETIVVQVESAEGPPGLLGAGPVHGGELRILRGIQHPVAVAVSHLDEAVRGGADSSVKAGPVVDGAAHGGGEFIGGDLLVAVGVHVPQQRAERCALPGSDGLSCRGIDGMAEGGAQPAGQLLIVAALPHAIPVGVDDGEAAFQHGPFAAVSGRVRPAVSSPWIVVAAGFSAA